MFIARLFFFLFLTPLLQAKTLDPIFFSSKQTISSNSMTSSSYSVNTEQVEREVGTRVTDIIANVPGIEVVQTGVAGGQASVFIRGAEGRHTLILIDGIKVYDPTSIGRTLNLTMLNSLDIEKIEVLKGSQSVLYGSDAIGGVINIITKKGTIRNKASLSHGYFSELSIENTIDVDGAGLIYLNGFYQTSTFLSESLVGKEKDKNELKGMTLNHTIDIKGIQLESLLKINNNFSNVDGYNFTKFIVIDDLSAYSKDDQLTIKETIKFKQLTTNFSYNRYQRVNKSLGTGGYLVNNFDGSVVEFETRYELNSKENKNLFGIDTIQETYRDDIISEKKLSMYDAFYLHNSTYGRSVFEIGSRITNNYNFGTHGVYQLGMKREVGDGKLHTVGLSSKTGFKAPTIYQQMAPVSSLGPVGNKNLAPEKSTNLEASYQYKTKGLFFRTSLFYNEVKDFIEFRTGSGYQNLSAVIYKGIEFEGEATFSRSVITSSLILINYKSTSGREITRRPNFSYNLGHRYKLNNRSSLSFLWTWKGRRFEQVGPITQVMKAFDTFDLDYFYRMKNWELITSFKNIFDREYEMIRGYSVLRRAFQLRLTYSY